VPTRRFRIATSLHPQRVLALDRHHLTLDPTGFTIRDLSGSGLLAETGGGLALTEGERLRLSLALDGESIEVTVAVTWVRPLPVRDALEIGCRFDQLKSREQIAILDHIRRNQVRAVG
jgi:hypothetical protein